MGDVHPGVRLRQDAESRGKPCRRDTALAAGRRNRYTSNVPRDYSKQIAEYWPTIMRAWEEFADKRPVIECDIVRRQVLAYPAKEYINELSTRTREAARRQYREVCAAGGIMVFVRDSKHKVLQSQVYTPDVEAQP